MRHHQGRFPSTVGTPVALGPAYEACRTRVDRAYQRLQAISAAPHSPHDARQAAAELAAALREATATAARVVRHAQPADGDAARWSRELLRLADIAAWLRWLTLDDLGVLIPTTVRVGSYAATGPHIAGLDVAADLHDPLIGIDLPAVIDRYRQDLATQGAVVVPVSGPPQAA